MQLFNLTPFAAERVVTSGRAARDTLLVVIKSTYDLARLDRGIPRLADEQWPVTLVDAYAGEPGQSSLVSPSDLVPEKPGAEVAMVGHVRPRRTGEVTMDVTLQLGAVNKTVRVFGDRIWERGLLGHRASAPKPIEAVPLVWERAFGGTDETTQERFEANPVGRGFAGKKSKTKPAGLPLPNLVDPRQPVESPSESGRPASFGFLAPGWLERRKHAGTYDAAWLRDVSPFLPADFDARYHLAAPRDQTLSAPLRGGEKARVVAGVQLDFEIPAVRLDVSAMMGAAPEAMPAICDTAVIDLDAQRLILVSRATLDVQDRLDEVQWIRVGLAA